MLIAIAIASNFPILSTQAVLAQEIDVHSKPVNRFIMPLNEYPLEKNLKRARYVNHETATVRSGDAPRGLFSLPNCAIPPAPQLVPVTAQSTTLPRKPLSDSPWVALFGHPNQAPLVASTQHLPDATRTPAITAPRKPALASSNQARSATTVTQAVPINVPNHQKHLGYVPAISKIADYNGKFFGPSPSISEHGEDERRSNTSVVGVVVRH